MGYPIAECEADGTAVDHKAPGTGGLVTPATVGEQILYEIGDPGAYVMPDVVCDWREVKLEQVGPTGSASSGAKGAAADRHLQGDRHPPGRLPRDDDGDVRRHTRRPGAPGAPARRSSPAPSGCSPRTASGR